MKGLDNLQSSGYLLRTACFNLGSQEQIHPTSPVTSKSCCHDQQKYCQ